MRMIMMLSALALSGTALGQTSLCYYWVDNDGAVTSYTTPPFNIETSNPISSDAGRLLIAVTDRCRNDQVIRAGVTTAAIEPEEPRRPAPRTMPPIPVPEAGPIPIPEPEVQLPVPESAIPAPEAPSPAPEAALPTPEAPAPEPQAPAAEPQTPPAPAEPETPTTPELRLEPPGQG